MKNVLPNTFLSWILLCGFSFAVHAGQNFTDFGDDHLWSNPDNWSSGVVPDDSETFPGDLEPQWHTDIQMVTDDTIALIDSTIDAHTYSLHVGAFGGDNSFEMTGGSLTVGPWALNIGRGGNQPNHEGSFGHMIMTGGTITAPFVVVPEQFVGSANDQIQKGEVTMGGGTINAGWMRIGGKIGEGEVKLSGTAAINLSGHLEMNPDGDGVAALDLSDDAVVTILGTPNLDTYQSFIDAGWLTANGGTAAAVLSQTETMLVISAASVLLGDYNSNDVLDAPDLDLQAAAIDGREHPQQFDLNGDSLVTFDDRLVWINDLKNTWIGDANLDLEFNSGDMVQVFARGTYETPEKVGWEDGDWNADQLFTSGDLVAAFAGGGYELGKKPQEAVSAVPEPSGLGLLVAGALAGFCCRRR